ncbi:MAG: SRPBCC family protein [Granulosicoccaceae bacterium]
MTMFCRADLSIGLPRHLLWELISDTKARNLWQPNVISAELETGYGGGKGSIVNLLMREGRSSIKVVERVTRSRLQDSLATIQTWPHHQIHNKFILTTESDETTHLTLQKRYKGQIRFAVLGKQLTRRQLETAAMEELLGIKNLSAQLHNRMAEQSMPPALRVVE